MRRFQVKEFLCKEKFFLFLPKLKECDDNNETKSNIYLLLNDKIYGKIMLSLNK